MTINMTEQQAKALCRILHSADTFDYGHGKGTYEIKQYDVDDCKYFISVVLEVGMVGDEDTLASILCRSRVHLFIGKRGGITYPVCKKGKTSTKHLSKTTLYGVMVDQKYS